MSCQGFVAIGPVGSMGSGKFTDPLLALWLLMLILRLHGVLPLNLLVAQFPALCGLLKKGTASMGPGKVSPIMG